MRVVRVYHGGRARAHRARERALVDAGLEVTLVVPAMWPEGGGELGLSPEPFEVVELAVVRPGDVNRHRYADPEAVAKIIAARRPDLVDIHEEPFSAVTRQLLAVVPAEMPVTLYTAQNVDKRYPPPFTRWERRAYRRATGLYPCSRQAAAVARRRGFTGLIQVLPLGIDPELFRPGTQQHDDAVFQLALASRMVPEKGVREAVRALSAARKVRAARLVLAGDGPEVARLPAYADEFGVSMEDIEHRSWLSAADVAAVYRRSHLVLAPSRATSRWVEQFGRMIPEAQASGAVVLGYASGAVPEVCEAAAWLAAEGDDIGLSRAAAHLAGNPAVWTEYRARGIAAAADKKWDAVGRAQASFYERCLDIDRTQGLKVHQSPDDGADLTAPATLRGGVARPFALPVLREWAWPSRLADRASRFVSRS